MITLDVTDIPLGHAHRGGPEDFRGGQRPVDALNAQADDSSYEILILITMLYTKAKMINLLVMKF